ncbi:hypothetical protein HYALB_00011068 [Hymenoscyphus albidus]|uniref:GIY-YIG domain-containing protein n=1 Tax=Hymenoscyphus albidus TaxID=595503 RepID=A0A9N9LGT7_9HELO|nr:hypothetical protein HYALB_00011068 [Hymenoscyphus albidus]
MPLDRPIPAFYCCYLLRSTVSHGSVYVGSTPHPVRRLRQHNGLAKGGASRTARPRLRPWEMACIITGFPSNIAALQFEWAWQNPHITLHIAPEDRIQGATKKKRSGHPKRPRHTVSSLLSNLHLLLRSPSFSRWPLEIRFFSKDVHNTWTKWIKSTPETIRDSIQIHQEFLNENNNGSVVEDVDKEPGQEAVYTRMSHIPIDYTGEKEHLFKSKDIIDFEREGDCAVCHETLQSGGGMHIICPASECEAVSHVSCLGKHFLKDDDDELVPIRGHCPSCKTQLIWVDLVKEMSLRVRGQKEVENLLKVKRSRKGKGKASSQAIIADSDAEESENELELEEEEEEEDADLVDIITKPSQLPEGDSWNVIDDYDASDMESIASMASNMSQKTAAIRSQKGGAALGRIVEDSDCDWDEVEVLD